MQPITLSLVAAVAENGVIGQDGRLPWRLRSDLKYFRRVTMNRPVIMGRDLMRVQVPIQSSGPA